MLRKQGHEVLTVLPYTDTEVDTLIEHGIRTHFLLSSSAGSKPFNDMVKAMSGYVPAQLTKVLKVL